MVQQSTEELNGSRINPRKIAQDENGHFDDFLDGHFLAGRTLVRRKVTNLLISASFGSNAILYATFLGYVMGLWGLVIQFAWMLSFFMLARYGRQIYNSVSLHEFLGEHFGSTTRRIAALCSIVGITYFAGWEIAVADSSLQSLVSFSGLSGDVFWGNMPIFLLSIAVILAIFYSSLWGRKASGTVNVFLNSVKVTCLILTLVILFYSVASTSGLSIGTFFPPLSEAILGLGIIGFITNIIFNLSWQFVDNSSWQSISSASRHNAKNINKVIKSAGLGTLLTVNGLGTVLGSLLRNDTTIDSSNILGNVVHFSSQFPEIALIAMLVLIVLSAISLFDGAILSISQSLVVDLGFRWPGKKVTLRYARAITLFVGIFSAWGVNYVLQALGGSIFDLVYVVILVQLSLIGPVIIGLLRTKHVKKMWLAIIISLLSGIVTTIIGITNNDQNLLQAAGTVTTAVSIVLGIILHKRSR